MTKQELRPDGRPVTRAETFEDIVEGVVYRGVYITHDGPCVFVAHQCSCGKMDVGTVE